MNNIISTPLINKAQAFSESKGGMFTVVGYPTSGKTVALKLLVEIFKSKGISVEYVTANEYLAYKRSLLELPREFSLNSKDKYIQAEFLAIDDFDMVRKTDWTNEALFNLINARYESAKQKYTAIAANTVSLFSSEMTWRLKEFDFITLDPKGVPHRFMPYPQAAG